ncbi:MAG: hypothetical protein K2L84_10465 [Muribaculaceae bacterium]|nr:hypothetical protein [Muribaculaceae bacterium]
MIKKALFLLSALLIAVAIPAGAQQKTGRWTVYPTVGESYDNVIETPERTYLFTGNNLYSISENDNESYAYNAFNKLSDSSPISSIHYNYDGGYLLVAYESGNIDLLYDDGSTVYLPEIKDAVVTTTHKINAVAFGHNRIFVGTEFGLVVFDDKKHQVIESGIYNQAVSDVFSMGDHIAIVSNTNMYTAPYDIRHNQLEKFNTTGGFWGTTTQKLNDNTLLYIHTDKKLYTYTFDFANNTRAIAAVTSIAAPLTIRPAAEGVTVTDASAAYFVSENGEIEKVTPPSLAKITGTYSTMGKHSMWYDTPEGITRFNMASGTPSMLMQAYSPEGITMPKPAVLNFSPDGTRLYVNNYEISKYHTGTTHAYDYISFVSMLKDGHIYNTQPDVISNTTTQIFNDHQVRRNTTKMVGGCTHLAVDPDDQDMYYIANIVGGVFVIKNREVVQLINHTNSLVPNPGSWVPNTLDVNIDHAGNLWVGTWAESDPTKAYQVLPAAKRRDIKNIKASDWIQVSLPSSYIVNQDMFIFFSKRYPNFSMFTNGNWNPGIVVKDNNNTPLSFSDDKHMHHMSLVDQDGNTMNTTFVIDMEEDNDGRVWIGTAQGPFVVDNLPEMLTSNRVRRTVVPRNDGSGFGDYLLSSEKIYKIATDHSNRKWFATETSGVYLVNADGTEIIQHFTTDNSALPSNTVYSVACAPNSNTVYFATANGLVSYDSDSSPAADDYSEVYAYPNPVRPEYTGWITVAGLMDNSLVKIADIAGNVFYQGTSEGGMISWDGCDANGNRVKTGVYLVFASQNSSGKTSGAVAKIMVIN